MSQPNKTDHRFALQLAMLCGLVCLPVTMVAVNGAKAIEAILQPVKRPDDVFPVPGATPDTEAASRTIRPLHAAPVDAEAESSQRRGMPAPAEASELRFGFYDPGNTFPEADGLQIRHRYVSWLDFDEERLADSVRAAYRSGFVTFLTVEPWRDPTRDEGLMQGIVAGAYDAEIDAIANALRGVPGPLYLSWGHEMDQDLTERYPWSGCDPELYVEAYRYVIDRLRLQVDTELRLVWAGVLKAGSDRYWPGDAYVDFIGMPIYSFPAWDQQTYGYIRDFRTTFESKRRVVSTLEKPLMITELGVHGSEDFEAFWLHQAFLALDRYPELHAVVFFYARDTEGAWGKELPTPDWRVNAGAIEALVDWKRENPKH